MTTEEKFSWNSLFTPLNGWTFGVVLILDQITKWLIILYLRLGDNIPLLPFLEITHIKNRGAAFGIFHNTSPGFRLVFFGVVTLICIVLLVRWLGSTPIRDRWIRLSLSLTLGGAVGNLIDRAAFGEVTDFVHVFYRGVFSYPAFNVADSAISVGITLLLFQLFVVPTWKKYFVSKNSG